MACFDGTHDEDFILGQLPSHVSELLTDEFLQNYAAAVREPAWLHEVLELTATYDYSPRAPLRLLYGSADDIVIPKEAEAAFAHMTELGGNVELVEVGAFDHEAIALRSLPSIQRWFDQLEGASR